jgi:hypothetical protein
MVSVHRVSSPRKPGILAGLGASLMFLFSGSCATNPNLPPTPVNTLGVAKVAVTFNAGTIQVNPDPVVGCYLGSCTPRTAQVHWDIATGEKLNVQVNPSYDDKPCATYPGAKYKKNPGFRTITCNGSHCETVGPPTTSGCFKYDITVTPSSGPPVTKDPDMIIM